MEVRALVVAGLFACMAASTSPPPPAPAVLPSAVMFGSIAQHAELKTWRSPDAKAARVRAELALQPAAAECAKLLGTQAPA